MVKCVHTETCLGKECEELLANRNHPAGMEAAEPPPVVEPPVAARLTPTHNLCLWFPINTFNEKTLTLLDFFFNQPVVYSSAIFQDDCVFVHANARAKVSTGAAIASTCSKMLKYENQGWIPVMGLVIVGRRG